MIVLMLACAHKVALPASPEPVKRHDIPGPIVVVDRPTEVPRRRSFFTDGPMPYAVADDAGECRATGVGVAMSVAESVELDDGHSRARHLSDAAEACYDRHDDERERWHLRESQLLEGIDYHRRDARRLRTTLPLGIGGGIVAGALAVIGAGWALGQVAPD